MTSLSDSLMEMANHIALRPQMYVGTPQEGNGMVLALAAVILREATGGHIESCLREANSLIRDAMPGVYPSDSIVASLADEAFPEKNPSFAAFSRNCRSFLEMLRNHISKQSG